MSTGKIVLGLVAGVAVGALLGVLFAPEKGSVTRKNFVDKKDDYAESMKKKFEEFVDSMSEKYENVKEDVSHFADHKNTNHEKA